MRVLHLSSSFPRRAGDVSGLFVLDLGRALVDAGVEVHVVAPHDAGAATDEVLDGVRVHRFRYAPDRAEVLAHRGGLLKAVRSPAALLVPAFLVSFWWSTRRAIRRLRPDVLHAHWWFPGGLVAALSGVPFVVTLHGSDVHLASGPLLPLARWVLRRAAVVGVVSEALRREAAERFGVDAVLLRMPLVVDGEPTELPPPPVRVVAIGRHAEEKGFDVLVAALEGTGIELDLFGEGTEALGGHGPASRATIAAALARAHALVVPSRREGLGLVAVEAMALGRPVIASAVGGLVETVGDDGVLVPPEDVEALRAALRRLPLPAPRAEAVARHRADVVAAAHVEAYVSARRR